jgi:hypothetical protein
MDSRSVTRRALAITRGIVPTAVLRSVRSTAAVLVVVVRRRARRAKQALRWAGEAAAFPALFSCPRDSAPNTEKLGFRALLS